MSRRRRGAIGQPTAQTGSGRALVGRADGEGHPGNGGPVPAEPVRRVVGMVVLLIAVFVVFAVPAALDPGIDGTARAAPMPSPPPVGSCLLLAADVRWVDCAAPHQAEITLTWSAGQQPPAEPVVRNVDAGPMDLVDQDHGFPPTTRGRQQACADALTGYVGPLWTRPLASGWHPNIPDVQSLYLSAPESERVGDYGWSACLALPTSAALISGTLRGLTLDTGRRWPSQLGTCVDEIPARELVECGQPHFRESLGFWAWFDEVPESPAFYINYTADELLAGCRDIVAKVVGTDDPTFGGRLRISVQNLWFEPSPEQQIIFTGADGSAYSAPPPPDCWVETTDGGLLTDSLVGWGDRLPLPVR